MYFIKDKKAVVKFSFLILSLIVLVGVIIYAGGVFASTHTSSAELEPEWSIPGVTNDYTVTICNNVSSEDTVDEIRIYKHELYGGFEDASACESKDGWELNFISTKKACHYIAEDPSYYIDSGECTNFEFHATAPSEDPAECKLQWKFETRDVDEVWHTIYDTTSIDSQPPVTSKDYGLPFHSDGAYDWINTDTLITLTAIDMSENCAIGVDETYYRVSGALADSFCNNCENWMQSLRPDMGPWNTYDTPFTIDDESCHVIEYKSIDLLDNEENIKWQCVFVDATHPEIEKVVGDPKREGEEGIFDWWITQETPITLNCKDVGHHPSNDVTIYWKWRLDDGAWNEGSHNGESYILYFGDSDSVHDLEFWCVDAVEKESEHDYETFKVDSTPPSISKRMIGENHLGICPPEDEEDECYVADDGKNGVAISVIDPDPTGHECAIGVNYCNYGLWWYTTEQECAKKYPSHHYNNAGRCVVESGRFSDYKEIIFREDSTHELYIDCWDLLGNKLPQDVEFFLVDSTPPETTKEYGTPTKVKEGYRWITSSTPITLTAEDEKVGQVYDNTIYWRNTLLEIPDEACLEQCQCESPEEEIFETVAHGHDGGLSPLAIITKTDNGDSVTFTWEFVQDNIPHPDKYTLGIAFATSLDNPDFQVWIDDSDLEWKHQEYGTGWNGAVTTGKSNVEALGFTLIGDSTGKTKSVTVPYNKLGGACSIYYFALQARINIMDKYPSTWTPWSGDVDGYAQSVIGGSGDFVEYAGPFNKPEESCHLVEYYSVDALGNKEDLNWQCVFVDNTAPTSWKEVGVPKVEGYDQWNWYVTQNTLITLDCEDQGDHPVDQETLYWRFSNWIDQQTEPTYSEWNSASYEQLPIDIHFNEDSWHDIEYYCVDHLGNTEETHTQYYIVDTEPPIIEKEFSDPWYFDGEMLYIDTATYLNVDAWDPEPHPVNEVMCNWRVSFSSECEFSGSSGGGCGGGGGYGQNNIIPPFIIDFPEESYHELWIDCWDALGNTNTTYIDFYVDKTPPVTTKTYGDPYFEYEDIEWITSDTEIILEADDPQPHPSGVKETYYAITQVDDSYCESEQACDEAPGIDESFFDVFTELTPPLTIPEQSCHMIEYYSIDNVDKTEEIKRQCVFVDNTPPTPEKDVGEPKEPWDGLDANFYDLDEFCLDEGNCWKVTLDTPISMTCDDPIPHPVGNEKICFNVELDGDDATDIYCNEYQYGGIMEDGFCCLEKTIEDFVFLESSEHNLEFYCVDALGNTNEEVHEEKFKVHGENFEIELNKKWNLISVPVVLLNDNIEVVFEDIAEDIDSVWTYDATANDGEGKWFVYIPDGNPSNDNLHTLTPGWGYWVLAKQDALLLIGGSLLAPGRTPPSRDLIPGWNIVGYYGMKDENGNKTEGYYGPNETGMDAYCALYSLTSGELGLPKWSSLYGYWQPIDFEGYSMWDELDPGAGYWINMKDNQQEYIYSPSTVCYSWFDGWSPV